METLNPEMFAWARQTAGLTLEEGAQAIQLKDAHGKRAAERLAELEDGTAPASRSLLERMAKAYRRSLLVFYLARPPLVADRGKDFRLAPGVTASTLDSELDVLIRDLNARQSIVKSLLQDMESEPVSFVGSLSATVPIEAACRRIAQGLGFSLKAFREESNTDAAFTYLRAKIESSGVFVLLVGDLGSHHSAISPERFRGFAIADIIAPFVVINDQDARSSWSFTALHELVHVWLGNTGISGPVWANEVEQYCNAVAGEFLLPISELEDLKGINPLSRAEDAKERITAFADQRRVSRAMVAYRLYLRGYISSEGWAVLRDLFRAEWLEGKAKLAEKRKGAEGGPDYYRTRRHRIGFGLTDLVRRALSEGLITYTKASKVLAVKPRNVDQLLRTRVGG